MKSLFLKIFLWFWLAMTLSSVLMFVLAITAQNAPGQHRRQMAEERMKQALLLYGHSAADIYTNRGRPSLADFERRLMSSGFRIYLFEGPNPLGSNAPSPALQELASKVVRSGNAESGIDGNLFLLALPLTGEGSRSFIVAGEWPNPPMNQRRWYHLLRRDFALRMAISLVIGALISYGLAWHFSGPIKKLSAATRQVAHGDLSARVGKEMGERKDEIAGLGRDFDLMAERIQALLKSQQRLIGDVSHELRSPLARLNVALELARRSSGGDARDPLDRIGRESERLNELIGQLLTLTQLESGIEKSARTRVELTSLVREIVGDADFEAKGGGRSVTLHATGETVVHGVEELLRRAIENVIRNAVRYTAEKTEVEVEVSRQDIGGGEYALVSVRDRGPGVPEEALSHLFEPFYRAGDARERRTGGAGIGLAITERAVHVHGGNVSASNMPGGGLKVEISLPAGTA